MDVAVTELRAHLSEWLDRARNGQEVVVTERGVPVVRIIAVPSASVLQRLIDEGVIARPARTERPVATGHRRSRARRPVSDIVSEQRG